MLYFSLSVSLFLAFLCNGHEPEKCLSWSMQSLVSGNEVECIPLNYFFHSTFSDFAFGKDTLFANHVIRKNQSVLNRNQVLVMGKYHNNNKASVEMKFG